MKNLLDTFTVSLTFSLFQSQATQAQCHFDDSNVLK